MHELTDGAVGLGATADVRFDVRALTRPLLAWPNIVIAVGVAGLAVYRLWDALLQPPIVWGDSKSYEAVGSHSVLTTAMWAGQRPPLIPLVWHMATTPTTFVVYQVVFSLLCWTFLAATVAVTFASPGKRVIAALTVLSFATVAPVVWWDASVLSESISISLLALLLATSIRFARVATWPRAAAVIVTALAFALARDSQVYSVGALGVGFGAFFLLRKLRRQPVAVPIGVLAVALVAGALLSGWGAAASGRTKQNVADALYVRIFPFPSRLAWFATHGMPQSQAIDLLSWSQPRPAAGSVKVVGIDPHDPHFASWERWLQSRGESTYDLWLLTHPGYVITEPLERPERAFNFAQGDLSVYAALDRVDSPLTRVLWPSWGWLVVGATIASIGPLVLRRVGRREIRVLAAFAVVGVASMLVAWHGDGQETTRHTVEGLAQVHLCVLLALVLLVLAEGPALVTGLWRVARDVHAEARRENEERLERLRSPTPV